MIQCKSLNVILFNLQLKKLKSGIENGTEVELKLSSNVFDDSNDENNFTHKIRKAIANNSLANIKLSKTQFYKIGQSRRFLDSILGPILKNQ